MTNCWNIGRSEPFNICLNGGKWEIGCGDRAAEKVVLEIDLGVILENQLNRDLREDPDQVHPESREETESRLKMLRRSARIG